MAKTVLNPRGIAEVKRSVKVMTSLELAAAAAAAHAKEIAPVDSGDYRDSIDSDAAITGGQPMARIYATDWKALWIEVGTSQRTGKAILRKSAEAVGLSVKGSEEDA